MTEGVLYQRDGDVFSPTPLTMGPWRPDAQHGGPPSGLLTLLCEELLEPDETLARSHVNLLRAVPLEPLQARRQRVAVSRRVTRISAELSCAGRPVAEATVLALRAGSMPAPDWTPEPPSTTAWTDIEPTVAPHWAADETTRPFHRDGLEHRFVAGRFDRAGPAVDWVRLRPGVVEGATVSGYQRVMTSVDVGSGISAVFDPSRGFGLINADLDVAFVAEPIGPWLRLEAVTQVGDHGTGMAVTKVFDEQRLVAVATQSLLGTTFNNG